MAILSRNPIGFDIEFVVVDHDPTSEATDCNRGSTIIHVGPDETIPFFKPVHYYKLDDGETTNVLAEFPRTDYNATGAPSLTDDHSQGWHVGSEWYSGTGFWKLVDHTVGAAVWVKLK